MKRLFFFFLILCSPNSFWGTLIFYHIPKSGGTCVETILGYRYSVANFFRIFTSQSISPYGEKWVEDPFYLQHAGASFPLIMPFRKFTPSDDKLVFGHVYFKDGFEHLPYGKNITFLRDPVKRVISHQKYWEICREYYPSADMNSSHVIPPGSPLEVANNLQVYYLSSFSREDPFVSLEEHLESAKQNLVNHFDFVGITEDFYSSMKSLFAIFGLGDLPDIPIINQFSFKKLELSHDEIEEIRLNNWADCELYSFAKKLFSKKFKNVPPSKIQVSEPEYVDKVHYTFDQALNGNGWGYRETSHSPPFYYRTTFKKNAWLDFSLKKNNYKIKFYATSPLQKNLFKLVVLVNNFTIPIKCGKKNSWSQFEGFIPQEVISENEDTRIVFAVPTLYKPSDHGQILDDRNLGISVADIDIEAF